MTTIDTTMTAITEAVMRARTGDRATARAELDRIWADLGPLGDPLHRCTLAHHLADLQDDPAQALAWDIRALDAADALTDERAEAHHPGLRVNGFYPSLHLNLADNYRRLGSFAAAHRELTTARTRLSALPEDDYGTLIRTALDEIEIAIEKGDTTIRPSATR